MKIFLTGMPGCGKSTFGRKVAMAMDLKFIDLDKEIIHEEQMAIIDIFESKGEDHFRNVESALLKKITQHNDHFILATGGGAPCFFDNMEFMNQHGTTIYIDTPVEVLIDRLSASGISKRPLIKKMDQDNLFEGLAEKLRNREPNYKMAKLIFKYNESLENDIIQYFKGLE